MIERPPIAEPTERYWRRRANRRVRKERFLQATARWARVVGVNALVLGVLGGACVYIVRDLADARCFAVTRVRVEGLERLSRENVLERLAPYRGTSLFRVDIDALERQVAGENWVERCTIRRRLPDTLDVRVVERRPSAIAVIAGRAWLVDDTATLIETATAGGGWSLPVLNGVEPESLPAALERLRLLRERAPGFVQALSEIDHTRGDRLVAHTIDPGPALWLDPRQVDRNVAAFLERRTEIDRRLGAPLVVDLRWDGQIAVTPAYKLEVE